MLEAKLPEDLQSGLERELRALKEARADKGASADYLQFMERLAEATANARAAIRAAAEPVASGSSQSHEDRLLSPEEVGFDRSILKQLISDLDASTEGEGGDTDFRKLARASSEDPDLLLGIVTASSRGEDARPLKEAADRLGLPVHALLLVGRLLATPFFMEARRRRGPLPELDMREVEKGAGGPSAEDRRHLRCPTCGSAPGLALLSRDGGSRRLLCLLCGESWLSARLMCASCGTKEQSKLATLCVSEDDPRWVEVCDGCRRYLKTVDENLLPEASAFVPRCEDARSLYLDVMADQEGYVRPAL